MDIEQGREHARLPWVMEHRLVGLDRDRAEPLPHAAHVVHCAVHLLAFSLQFSPSRHWPARELLLSLQHRPRCKSAHGQHANEHGGEEV